VWPAVLPRSAGSLLRKLKTVIHVLSYMWAGWCEGSRRRPGLSGLLGSAVATFLRLPKCSGSALPMTRWSWRSAEAAIARIDAGMHAAERSGALAAFIRNIAGEGKAVRQGSRFHDVPTSADRVAAGARKVAASGITAGSLRENRSSE
jgi:hypothetical protein